MSSPLGQDQGQKPVRRRDGDRTRARILDAAFAQMHERGYQALRVDSVLESTGLTKGAFYHHFSSKRALGEAVIGEVLAGMMEHMWERTLQDYVDPLEGIKAVMRLVPQLIGQKFAQLGCPLNNLTQELAPVDEGFRKQLHAIFERWISAVEAAIRRGQSNGIILPGIDPHGAAVFIIASYEGAVSLTKARQSLDVLANCASQIEIYLEGLRT